MITSQDKLIVFDWDGTLIDSIAKIVACLQAAVMETGLASRSVEQLRQIIGLGLKEAITSLFPDIDERQMQQFVQVYRRHFLHDCPINSELFAGARNILGLLAHHGYMLAVATSKGRHGLDIALQQTSLAAVFHATRCADETCSKPDPQMLLEIMAQLNVAPEHTLMIGDTEYDMEMAQRAGVRSIAVTYGVHERAQLEKYQPITCINDINELRQLLPAFINDELPLHG